MIKSFVFAATLTAITCAAQQTPPAGAGNDAGRVFAEALKNRKLRLLPNIEWGKPFAVIPGKRVFIVAPNQNLKGESKECAIPLLRAPIRPERMAPMPQLPADSADPIPNYVPAPACPDIRRLL